MPEDVTGLMSTAQGPRSEQNDDASSPVAAPLPVAVETLNKPEQRFVFNENGVDDHEGRIAMEKDTNDYVLPQNINMTNGYGLMKNADDNLHSQC